MKKQNNGEKNIMTIIDMIRDVIEGGGTTKQIVNKLNDKHIEYFGRKVLQLGTKKRAITQMCGEVGSIMKRHPEDFNIDRSGPRNVYSFKPATHASKKPKTVSLKKRVERLEKIIQANILSAYERD